MKKLLPFLIMMMFMIPIVQAGITGMTKVEISTDSLNGAPIFNTQNNQVWLLTWNAIDTDFVEGTLSPLEFKQLTGVESSGSFSLKMQTGNEILEYRFLQDSSFKPVYKSRVRQFGGWKNEDAVNWISGNCQDLNYDGVLRQGMDYIWYKNIYGYEKVVCIDDQVTHVANIGTIDRANEIFSTTFTLTANGQSETKTITNAQNVQPGSTTRFGNVALIKWQGSLSTGKNAPVPVNILGAHHNSFGWKLISTPNYNDWKNYVSGGSLSSCLDLVMRGGAASNCESEINTRADRAIGATTDPIFRYATVTSIDLLNGKFTLDKDANGAVLEGMKIPQFQVFINSDVLKLVIPTGVPEIGSVTPNPVVIDENAGGVAKIEFKNIGQADGSFEGRITTCTTGFSASGLVQRFNIGKSSSLNKDYSISFASADTQNAEKLGTCTVVLRETSTGKEVTKTFSVKGIQAKDCTPGSKFEGIDPATKREAIYQCNSSGVGKTLLQVCEPNYRVDNVKGELQCVKNNDDDTVDPPIVCRSDQKLVSGGLFGKDKCEDIKEDNTMKYLAIAIYSINASLAGLALISLGYERFVK